MEYDDGKSQNQRTSGNHKPNGREEEVQKSSKRNPAMLLALDAVHRSLLSNNLKYEAHLGDARIISDEDDDENEYFSSKSSIASDDDDTSGNTISLNNLRRTKNRNVDKMPTQQNERAENVRAKVCAAFAYGMVDADEMLHSNRSQYFNCHAKNKPKTQRRNNAQHKMELTMRPHNEGSAIMHQENRCYSRNIGPCVEQSTKETEIMKSAQQQQRCAMCKCVKTTSSDTDDVTSTSENRDSDTNLLIENLRNRECEMFQKICLNNGYYSRSGTTSNYTSDTNSAVSMVLVPHDGSKTTKKCFECNNLAEKMIGRKQRLAATAVSCGSIRQHHVAANANTATKSIKSKKSKQAHRKNSYGSDRNSNVSEQSRRITITIKTKTVSDAASNTVNNKNVQFFNDYETEDSGDTTESEYTTVNGSGRTIANIAFNAPANSREDIAAEGLKLNSDEENNDDDDDDAEQSKSESSVFLSLLSEQSQYFDCLNESSTSLCSDKRLNSEFTKSNAKMRTREYKKCDATKETSDSPMICIRHELARDRTVTSQVQVNRAKIRAFKKRQKELQRPKIIDDTFCEEILNETLKLPSVVDAKRISVDRAVSVCSDEMRAETILGLPKSANFMSDRFSIGNLGASPKYTGKSIGRLLAHRLEQQTMTRVRRTLLQQTGIELAIAEEKSAERRKKLDELPPIKPPRSFATPSSTSPNSKQSVESSTTIPIEELKYADPSYIGFVIPSSSSAEQRRKPSTHIGWVRTDRNEQNESRPSQQNSMHFYTAESGSRLGAREDIDTVDCSTYASAQAFETFSATLDDDIGRVNLSTPIKSKSTDRSDQFTTANASTIAAGEPVDGDGGKRCTNCHGTIKKKSSTILSTKNGRKIGKAALKRTKTLIDSSKQFLMKSKKNKSEKHCIHDDHKCCNVAVETPVKDADNTAHFNSETFYSCEQEKSANKSLNLASPQRPSAPPAAELNPSPDRRVRKMDTNLLRTIPNSPPSAYATPNTSFNFDRVIEPPNAARNIKPTGKSSPAKLISKLNQIAKNSKTLFRNKEPVQREAKVTAVAEAPRYYRSYGGNQVDASVPLMGETLRNLRDKLETERRPVPAARKSLFAERCLSISSGDPLEQTLDSERFAEIELHEEPEPLYAKIEFRPAENTSGIDSNFISDESERRPKSAVRVDEVFVARGEGMPPSKYIMVNNDPKTLYATVNRNATTTETKSTDSGARIETCSSCESLDISSIGEFAQSLQEMMDENQVRMRRIYRNGSESGGENDADLAIDDLSSGCSSFYRKSRHIAETATESKRWQDFMESLSLGTVQTGSYCESVGRGNDVNGEITKSIGIVERTANVSAQFSQSDGLSYDCDEEDELMQTAQMDASGRNMSSNRTTDFQTPSSCLSSTTNSSTNNSKSNSPNFKQIKNKVRESFRKGKNYLRSGSKRWSSRSQYDANRSAFDSSHDASFASAQPCSSICNYPKSHDEKLYKTIHSKLLELPTGGVHTAKEKKMLKLNDRIAHHQSIRHELSDALEMCRSTKEFQNSPELIESERLILVSNLKELAAKEELTRLWQIDSNDVATPDGRCVLSVVYAEFALKEDAIYDTHFNYFYVCVLSHCDTIECSTVKERDGNRVTFNDLQVQFTDLSSAFEVRVEMFVLRLRKNQCHTSIGFSSKHTEPAPSTGNASASRFRFHGRTTLTSHDLSQNKRKQFAAQRNLRKNEQNDSMVFTMYDIVKMDLQLHGDMNNLSGDMLIGFQNEITFDSIEHSGFVDIAQKKWKWDRLWCRIDGFRMNFWAYPQDAANSVPLLTLDLQQCTSTDGIQSGCREMCAKARSFKLDFRSAKTMDIGDEQITPFFIAASTQNDLDDWLKAINSILHLMNGWNI